MSKNSQNGGLYPLGPLKTGQLRNASTRLSPNPYDLYSCREVADIGAAIALTEARDLAVLRRRLRDTASVCIRARDEHARREAPSERAKWIRNQIISPAKKLQRELPKLRDRSVGYIQDLEQTLRDPEPFGRVYRFVKEVEDKLFNLEQWANDACDQLTSAGSAEGQARFLDCIVGEFSGLYVQYMPPETIGMNKRFPENSACPAP